MDFRREQLDQRRRRVLMEEVTAPADGEHILAAAATRRTPSRAYGEAVLTDRQLRISDLVAIRPFVITMLVLAMLTGVAAIETLYICWQTAPARRGEWLVVSGEWSKMPRTTHHSPLTSSLASIDLAARGNLASWYSSLLLAAGACGALAIFSIRCHRVDDYRGRYRVWLWTAAGLAWASLDSATGIHEALGAVMALLARVPQLAYIGWLALYLLVFGGLAIRLGIETWHAVGSFSTLSIAAVLYLIAGMTAVGWIPLPGYLLATVLETTLVMLAHVTLLAGLLVYARHVHLDAEGKLPLRLRTQGPKPKRKSRARLGVVGGDDDKEVAEERKAAAKLTSGAAGQSSGTTAGSKESAAASSPGGARPGPLASRVAASVSRDDDDEDGDEGDVGGDGSERLSKSERRRLKKLMRQQRRAA